VGHRRRGRRKARYRDVRPRRGGRIRPDEEQDREPDVPEDEAKKATDEGHEEAPETDPRQRQPVHRLEYAP
jgi:hypothetical protein